MSDTFQSLLAQDSRGFWWGLEVSFDQDFSSVSYRWATHSGVVGGNFFEGRIASPMRDITRGFGTDHLPAAANLDVELDNSDFAIDFLCDPTQFETATVRLRFRLLMGVFKFDPANPGASVTVLTQQIGYFVCLDFPQQYNDRIVLALADDQLGQLNDLLTPPTTNDWLTAGNAATNPLVSATVTTPNVDFNQPWPLMFGAGKVNGIPLTQKYTGAGGSFTWPDGNTTGSVAGGGWRMIMVCATAELSNVNSADVVALEGVFRPALAFQTQWAQKTVSIPPSHTFSDGHTEQIWAAQKSESFSVGGYNWKLLWIAFNGVGYSDWFQATFPSSAPPGAPGPSTPSADPNDAWGSDGQFLAFDHFNVYSYGALSAVNGVGNTNQNPVDVIQDLVQYYSYMRGFSGGPIDTARFNRARAARHGYYVKGTVAVQFASQISTEAVTTSKDPVIGGSIAYQGGVLRQALTGLCGSADVDLFLTYAGQAACVAQVADFQAATTVYPSVDETHVIADTAFRRVPSLDERWSPFNAVFISTPNNGAELGPFINTTAKTAWGGRTIVKHLDGSWWPYLTEAILSQPGLSYAEQESIVWAARSLEAKARPVEVFDTDFGFFGLNLDLGDDFLYTRTRGGLSDIYTNALFRVEQTIIHAETGIVTVTAVFMDDLQTVQAYLLDDETLLTKSTGSGGRTATVADSSTTVTFSSGSLITDGVAAGDHLILKDSTETARGYKRNRALKIASVTDATHLVITDPSLDFGGGGAVSAWEIRRSYLTYPTSGTDPTHYPNSGKMYGKVANESDQYGDASAANELLDG